MESGTTGLYFLAFGGFDLLIVSVTALNLNYLIRGLISLID